MADVGAEQPNHEPSPSNAEPPAAEPSSPPSNAERPAAEPSLPSNAEPPAAVEPNAEPTTSSNTERPGAASAEQEQNPTAAADTTAATETRMTAETTATADTTANRPPRFTWARPSVKEYNCTINHYVKDEVVAKVQRVLRVKGGNDAVESFKKGPFGHFLDLRIGSSANAPLHQLMCHELEDNSDEASEFVKWFRIGETDVSFSAADYAIVTGLLFGSKNIDPNAQHHNVPKSSIMFKFFGGNEVRIEHLYQKFDEGNLGDEVEDYVKAANIIFLYHLLICGGGDVVISDWVWTLVENKDRWKKFPWGTYTFQILCHGMSLVPKHMAFFNGYSYHIFGPMWALQIWSYEVIPDLGKICGQRDEQLKVPRCLMWQTHKCSKKTVYFFQKELRIIPLEPNEEDLLEDYCYSAEEWAAMELEVLFVPKARQPWKKLPLAEQCRIKGIDPNAPWSSKKATKKPSRATKSVSKKRKEPFVELVDESPRRAKRASKKRKESVVDLDDASPSGAKRDSKKRKGSSSTCCLHGHPCGQSHMHIDMSKNEFLAALARTMLAMNAGQLEKGPSRSSNSIGNNRGFSGEMQSEERESERTHEEEPGIEQTQSEEHESQHTQSEEHESQQTQSEEHEEQTPNKPQDQTPTEPQPTPRLEGDDSDFSSWDDEEVDGNDTSLGPRRTRPTAALRSPFIGQSSRTPSKVVKLYNEFRKSEKRIAPPIKGSRHQCTQKFFMGIEDSTKMFTGEVLDLYMLYKKKTLSHRLNVIMEGVDLYDKLVEQFTKTHGKNPYGAALYNKNSYKKWPCPDELVERAKTWIVDGHIVMFCKVGKNHWVTVRVVLKDWTVELYDSMSWKYDTELGVPKKHRVEQLKPVTRLLPRIVYLAGYWEKNRKSKENIYEMKLKVMPDSMQLCQTDSVNCGAYCCMYLDRLVGNNSSRHNNVDEKYLKGYRLKVAHRIFSLTV